VPVWLRKLKKARIPVARVLDIGGAYGTLALYCKRLFACEVFVTDFVDSYLASRLSEEFGIEFRISNIETEELPWPYRYDVILLTEVLEHFNFQPQQTLEKIRDLLSDDGRLFLTTPDAKEWGRTTTYYDSLSSIPAVTVGTPPIDAHIWQYSRREVIELVTGFEIERFSCSPSRKRHFNLQLRRATMPKGQ
jgi:2-polyprenyl-3-methyl-5-hydroxy-6-metoxy-1,4-benzoquinol methylase